MPPTSLPITDIDPSSKQPSSQSTLPKLTQEQQHKLDTLVRHFNSDATLRLPATVKDLKAAQKYRLKSSGEDVSSTWTGKPLPHLKESSASPLSDQEKAWLTSEQLQRFLRAVKWDLPAAFSRAEETLVWRREFDVDGMCNDPASIEEESKTGKQIVLGWDCQQRPCLYMYTWKQNTKESLRQVQFVVWGLECAVELMPPGVEKLCLLLDFGSGHGGGNPTSLSQGKRVLDILQNYYCERLGRAICVNVPMVFYGFYRLISPFIDPVTKDKIRFNPDVRTLVPPSQLEKENFGGDCDFQYQHDVFWPAMFNLYKRRRELKFERWQKYGNGKAGVSEFILKGGDELPVNGHVFSGDQSTPIKSWEISAIMSLNPNTNTSSPARSVNSIGYQLPPDAEHAPDWHEPDSPRAPSEMSPSSSVTSHDDKDQLSPSMLRDRRGSSTSFASVPAAPAHVVGTARDDDALEASVATLQASDSAMDKQHVDADSANGKATVDVPQRSTMANGDLETGIAGLVIKPDGSIAGS